MKPFIEQRADPYIIRKDGWYYFTASVPEFDRIILRKARTLKELPDGVILVVPFNEEREEPHELRVRKRLNSYGQRAAALMR